MCVAAQKLSVAAQILCAAAQMENAAARIHKSSKTEEILPRAAAQSPESQFFDGLPIFG